MKTKLTILVTCTLLLAGCSEQQRSSFYDVNYSGKTTINYLYNNSTDIQFERTYINTLVPVALNNLRSKNIQEIYNKNGSFIGLDYAGSKIYKIDSALAIESFTSFDNSKNKNYNILYSSFEDDRQELTIFDFTSQTLVSHNDTDKSSNIILSKFDSTSVYRFHEVSKGDAIYVRNNAENTDLEFIKINTHNNEKLNIVSLNKLLDSTEILNRPDYSFDGRFVYDGNRFLVYYSSFNSYFIVFDLLNEDVEVKSVFGVASIPPPKISARRIGTSSSQIEITPTILFFKCGYIQNSIFYQLNGIGVKNRCLDMYDLNTSQYIGSTNIPDYNDSKPVHFFLDDNYAYVLYENKMLIKYEVNYG